MNTPKVVIIGAGLTGLTVAHNLSRKGIPCLILEKSSRSGGVIHTGHESGFTYETGPNTGVIGNSYVVRLFDELAGSCTLETAKASAKKRLILKNGTWHALPSGLLEAIRTPLFTAKDKCRILAEPFRKRGRDPLETLAELVKRRMGRSFLDYAVDPFISGIYAGNPAYLVTRFALPKLYALEQKYGSFILGALKKKFEKKEPGAERITREVFSAENGLGSLITALEKSVGADKLILNASEIHIKPDKNCFKVGYRLNGVFYSAETSVVITTTPAPELPTLLPFVEEELLSPVTKLSYARVVQVIMGFRKWKGMDINAFGGLIPSKENRKLLGILLTSSFLKNRAPEGGALLSAFLGGERNPEVLDFSDEDIVSLIKSQIIELLKTDGFHPDILKIFRYVHAIPQYGKDSEERLHAIKKIQNKYPGLILAGNIRDGIGMADRIQQAGIIAGEVLKTWG